MSGEINRRACLLFASMSHPVRLKIVELLISQSRTVNEIAADIGLSQSGTSQHLAILTRAGILKVEQHGNSRIYTVRGPRVEKIVRLIDEFCEVHSLYGDVFEDETLNYENVSGLTS